MSYSREEWKKIFELPSSSLAEPIRASLKAHSEVIAAWVKGQDVEKEVAKGRWETMNLSHPHFGCNVSYRVAPVVDITARLSVGQAQALYRVMEECTFSTTGSQAARNSIMRSIETELRKAGY